MPAPLPPARSTRRAAPAAAATPATRTETTTTTRRADNYETRAAKGTKATQPFSALAKRGDFTGYVTTASGQEVFVSIRLGKDPGKRAPLVMLDGIAAGYDRNTDFEKLLKKEGQSVISVFLAGQGETLLADVKRGGTSLSDDIQQEQQAATVVEVLDALGIKAPVGIGGLSYGGAIAAQCEKQFPDRFSNVLLTASFQRSEGLRNGSAALLNNPWNPFGPAMYRAGVRAGLGSIFKGTPPLFKDHPRAFQDGLYRLTMGLEDFSLQETVKGMKNVHFLVVPEDGASPPEENRAAFKGVSTGSFKVAPKKDSGKHDLVRGNGKLVAQWMAQVMAGEVTARAPR